MIVNTLVGAGLNYLGSVLPCPDDWIKKISDIIWHFYWDGKPELIKRNTITGPTNLDGTGLINVKCKLQSLKLKWLVSYLTSNGKWKSFLDYWICKAGEENHLGWYVLIKTNCPLRTTPFYRELIRAFNTDGGKINALFSCVRETNQVPLWNNPIMTTDKKETIDSNVLKSVGIVKLQDALCNDELITYQEIAKKCKILNINAGRIASRLQKHVDQSLVKENRSGPMNHICNWLIVDDNSQENGVIFITKTSVKSIYCTLNLDCFIVPHIQDKWQNILHYHTNLNWPRIWKSASSNDVMDSNDKNFWFKIKHMILPTKNKLHKMKITPDNVCPMCNSEPETIEHLFIYCRKN